MSDTAVQAGIGTATLSSDNDDGFTFHGVALGANDVTVGKSGDKKIWTPDALKAAADSLKGSPLVKDHNNTTDGTVGTVTKAKYKDGVGVLYEARIAPHYEEMAQDIQSGLLDVSPRVYHAEKADLEKDDDSGAYEINEDTIRYFDNLSVVSDGASPSNTAEPGEAALSSGGDHAVAVLERGSEIPDESSISEELGTHEDVLDLIYDFVDLRDKSRESLIQTFVTWAKEDTDMGSTVNDVVSSADVDPENDVVNDLIDEIDTEDDSEENSSGSGGESEELRHGEAEIGDLVKYDNQFGSVTGIYVDGGVKHYDVSLLQMSEDGLSMTDETDEWIAHNAKCVYNVEREIAKSDSEYEMSSESDDDVAELKSVTGVTFDGTKDGDLDESEIPNDDFESHYLYPAENKSDSSYPVVDADGNLRKGNVSSAWELGARGGVSKDDLHSKLESLNSEFDDPPIDPEKFGEDEDMESGAESNDEITVAALRESDDGTAPSKAVIAALNENDSTMTDIQYHDATDVDLEEGDYVAVDQEELEALTEKADKADDFDSRLDSVDETLEQVAEHKEIIDEVDEENLEDLRAYDSAVVMTEEEHDELRSLVDDVADVYAEALEQHSAFDAEELTDRFTPTELRDKVESHDTASLASEVESESDPEPNGGAATDEELESGSDTEDEPEFSEDEARDEIAEQLEDAGYSTQAQKVRDGGYDLEELVDGAIDF